MKLWTMKAAALAAVLTLVAGPVWSAPLAQGQFAGSLEAGAEFPVDGDLHGGATAQVASLAALNPNLPAANAELRIQSRSYDDIYGEAATIALEGAYGLGSNREVFAAVRRTEADESQVQVGTAFVPALSAELPVFGRFGAYEATSLEVGLRQYFGGESAIKPYIAGRAGVTFVDEIRASFSVPVPNGVGSEPNDIAINNVAFYDETTSFIVGVDVGVSFDVTDRFSLSAETGLRYQGELDGNDSAIGGLGLASINDDGARVFAPLVIRGSLKF
jgi:hypothetical protein